MHIRRRMLDGAPVRKADPSLLEIARASAAASVVLAATSKPRRMARELEHREQVMLVQYLEAHPYWKQVPWYAVPNGGERGKATAGKLKAEGVRTGVPDLVLPDPVGLFHGLYLELKAAPPERYQVSETQREFQRRLAVKGYAVAVARGCDAAIEVLEAHRAREWQYCEAIEARRPAGPRWWWVTPAG